MDRGFRTIQSDESRRGAFRNRGRRRETNGGALRLCKDQGIKVVLIYSPEYREMQTFTTNRAQIFERFGELTYRFGAPVWDYSSSPISARRENFYNSQHLNAQGAMTFSKDLAENLAVDPILGLGAARPYRKEKSQ
jgi:hypothetical protein